MLLVLAPVTGLSMLCSMLQRAAAFASKRVATLLLCCVSSLGCSSNNPATPAPPDRMRFETQAYPVLLRDCGFPACHGSRERFFQVFGPGRVRLPSPEGVMPDVLRDDPTPFEISYSYDRARSMQFGLSNAEASPLLRKPLEPAAGGAGHHGKDNLGRDVYRTKAEDGYQTLLGWVNSMPSTAGVTP